MKKTALKALFILLAAVLVCVFFSGTFHYITTAKVRLARAKTGVLEAEITMAGSLQWPEDEEIRIGEMKSEDVLTLRRMAVNPGDRVKAGDLIAVCEMGDDTRETALRDAFASRETEYLELERKNGLLQLSPPEEEWFEAFKALRAARENEQTARQELRVAAWRAGVALGEDDALPEGIRDEALLAARAETDRRAAEAADARSEFDRLNRLNISEDVIAYLEKKAELEAEMAALSSDMTALRILKEQASAVTAPHDGYITAAELKPGDTVTRATVIARITAEGSEPFIRLDPGENRRSLEPGLEAVLEAGGRTVQSAVEALGISADGKPAVDAALPPGALETLGGAAALCETGAVTARIRWNAGTSSTLIPTAALRGAEGAWYVYTARSSDPDAAAENRSPARYTAVRRPVTVLGQAGAVTSVAEDLSWEDLAYMEDRPLEDGCEIMPYDET